MYFMTEVSEAFPKTVFICTILSLPFLQMTEIYLVHGFLKTGFAPLMAKFVHLQGSGFGKIFSTHKTLLCL